MRYASKQELVDSIEQEHQALLEILESVPRERWLEAGVWGDGWNVRDLLAHLTEWTRMFLNWFDEGRMGGTPAMPAPGYKWNQTPALNREIQQRHGSQSVAESVREFDAAYLEVLTVTKRLSPDELLTPGHFAWTGKYPLTTYLAPNTCSHYRFAIKVMRRWLRAEYTNR